MSKTSLPAKPTGGGQSQLSIWVAEDRIRAQVAASLNKWMDVDQFLAHCLVTFKTHDKARLCTPESQLKSVTQMAAMGLLETLDQCAIIARKEKGTERYNATVMPTWQGYKAVMERHPAILEVQPSLVHVRDDFTFENGVASHAFDPFDPERSFSHPQDIRGGYCRILYRDGRSPRYHFVTIAHIEKCRKCAQHQDIWTPWYEQMCLKTLYRDCYARRAVPVDPLVAERLERMLVADNEVLGNDPRIIGVASVPSGNARLASALGLESPEGQSAGDEPTSPPDEPEPAPPEPTPKATDPPGQPDFGKYKDVCDNYIMDIGISDTLDGLNAVATIIQENRNLPAENQTYFVEQVRKQAAKIKKETG